MILEIESLGGPMRRCNVEEADLLSFLSNGFVVLFSVSVLLILFPFLLCLLKGFIIMNIIITVICIPENLASILDCTFKSYYSI